MVNLAYFDHLLHLLQSTYKYGTIFEYDALTTNNYQPTSHFTVP